MDTPFQPSDTAFASPTRASMPLLLQQRGAFLSEPVAASLLEAMPGPAMVLNRNRQVIAANQILLDAVQKQVVGDVIGSRPGELVCCRHAHERPAGCGTSSACAHCGAVGAVLEAFRSETRVTRECRISTISPIEGGALDYRVHATFVTIGSEHFVVVGLEDISNEKRRRVLERAFFHDLLDLCGDLSEAAQSLAETSSMSSYDAGVSQRLRTLTAAVMDQIEAQRQILSAERGELETQIEAIDVSRFIAEMVEEWRHHPLAESREVRFESARPCQLRTDPGLLKRVVSNLVRNALEATEAGGEVSLTCEFDYDIATITVHNDGMMSERTQQQIFQRSFTTKDGEGRGVGTYSVKLLTEQFLLGNVQFVSNERVGTLFMLMIPDRTMAQPIAA